MRGAWIWTWGLRGLERECEEERLGVSIYIGRYVYIRLCFPFLSFYSSSLWVEKQTINQSIETKSNKQTKQDIHLIYSS